MSWAEVQLIGGHLDGATMRVQADARGVPVEQLLLAAPPAGGWCWTGSGPPLATGLAVTCYRRERIEVGGLLLGWRMVAAR